MIASDLQPAVDVGPFQQGAVVDELLKIFGGDEGVVDPLHLARAGGPRGGGDAEVQVGDALPQTPHQGGLPDSGGAGQDNDPSGPSAGVQRVRPRTD